MRSKKFDFDLDTADPDGFADLNDSSGTSLTLDGALTSGGTYTSVDGLAHQLSITDTATVDQSGATFTVTGTDADDKAQVEAITGPGSGATVTSTKYFKTVSSVAIASGAGSGTVDMGTSTGGVAASKTIPLDHYCSVAATVQSDVTGTINFDIEETLQSPFDTSSAAPFAFADQEDLAWVNDANVVGETADNIASLGVPGIRAIRFTTNSYSAGAEVQLYITQPGSSR